jgi:hypothetical protein
MGERVLGWHRIEDADGSPYMFRAWIGRLRLHVFYRGDNDPDPHDHPWDFWTFPLTTYVEEVTKWACSMISEGNCKDTYITSLRTVRALRLHHRPATYTHRVLGRGSEDDIGYIGMRPGKIVTIVWRGKTSRKWGFLKHRDGKWCWVHWKEYVLGGGKTAPCAPSPAGPMTGAVDD